MTIGNRIRKIRTAKGLSQTDLGQMVGLTADRIQKYENGASKPKSELLKKIANALGVNSLALSDPTTASDIEAMFTLFELENNFNMKLEKAGTKLCLSIDCTEKLWFYMKVWYERYMLLQEELELAITEKEKQEELIKNYNFWKWKFPYSLKEKSDKNIENRKAELKAEIERLQKLYNEL